MDAGIRPVAPADRATRLSEWRANWPLVLTAFFGMAFPSAPFFALGLFMDPLAAEFGWSRTEITLGASISGLIQIPLVPFVGALIDRWGVRRLAIPGAILTGALMAAFGLASGSPVQWAALWVAYGVVILLLKSTIWATAIAGRFDAGRNLALGVVMSGTAFTTVVVPPVARWLTDSVGWREAWMFLGVGGGVPVLILCVLFLFDHRDKARLAEARVDKEQEAQATVALRGLTVRQAYRNVAIIRIALSSFVTLLLANALLIHKVPLLVEAGVTREMAAYLTSLSGIAGVIGSLTTGWLMDRFDAGRVGGVTFFLTAVALVFLLEPFRSPLMIVLSMLIVGYSGGTKLQIGAYLTSRYAGLLHFGKVYSLIAGIIAVTTALGPLFGSVIYDLTGSYDLLVMVGIPISVLSALLIVNLGPYPDWDSPRPA